MLKQHELNTVVCEVENALISVSYFYTREKRDINGNSRFRVFIIDSDGTAVYERIFKCYEFQLSDVVKNYMEEDLKK